MFDISEYKNWIDKREQIDYAVCVSENMNENVVEVLRKCKFPQRLLGFLFLPEEKAFRKLDTFYLSNNGEYSENTYYENELLLKKYTIICTSNGNAICINDETGVVEEVSNTNFKVTFVNKSFEEFMEFVLYYAQMLEDAEDLEARDTRIERLKIEDIEKFEERIRKEAGDLWEKYIYWSKKVGFLKFFVGI